MSPHIKNRIPAILIITVLVFLVSGCNSSIRGTHTMFWNLANLNTAHDDMNSMYWGGLDLDGQFVFSSNGNSSGGNFDIVRGWINNDNDLVGSPGDLVNLELMAWQAVPKSSRMESFIPACTSGFDEKGPLMVYDGTGTADPLDTATITDPTNPESAFYWFFFDSNRPDAPGGTDSDRDIYWYHVAYDALAPHQVGFNSSANDAYPSLVSRSEGMLFASERAGGQGGWDIWQVSVPGAASVSDIARASAADCSNQAVLNSPWDDNCPSFYSRYTGQDGITDGILVFVSNRDSLGGNYDLFYSIRSAGSWSEPRRLEAAAVDYGFDIATSPVGTIFSSGPSTDSQGNKVYLSNGVQYWLNSDKNEFRPVLFPNKLNGGLTGIWLAFSSDRSMPDAKGGYDLYLAWLDGKDFPDFEPYLY